MVHRVRIFLWFSSLNVKLQKYHCGLSNLQAENNYENVYVFGSYGFICSMVDRHSLMKPTQKLKIVICRLPKFACCSFTPNFKNEKHIFFDRKRKRKIPLGSSKS